MLLDWFPLRSGSDSRRVSRIDRAASRTTRPSVEPLETRQLLATTAVVDAARVLHVTGEGNISLQIQQMNYDQIQVVSVQGASATFVPIAQVGVAGTVTAVSAQRLTGIQVSTGDGTNQVVVGVHVPGKALYNFPGQVRVQGGSGVDTLENDLYTNCILGGGGAPGRDNFIDTTAARRTIFSEPFNPSQPALPGPGSGPDAAYTDVVQGAYDNCYFLAALSSLALTNPTLAGRIVYQGNSHYAVSLFARGPNNLPYLKPISVAFNGGWTAADPYEPQSGEFWTILYSRAFNALRVLNHLPATDSEAWFALTGRNSDGSNSSVLNLSDAKRISQVVLGGGNAVIVTARTGVSAALIPNHFYTVVNAVPAGPADYLLTLRNPWGRAPNATGGQFQILWSLIRSSLVGYSLNAPLYISDGQGGLYAVDLFNGAAIPVGSTQDGGQNVVMFDIALSPAGQLFGLGSNGDLYTIDRGTAAATNIGPITDQATGQPIANNANAMTFRSNGILYVAAQNFIYTVDPQTAVATKVVTMDSGKTSAGDLVFDPSGNLFLTTTDGTLMRIAAGTTIATIVGSSGRLGVTDIYGLVWFQNALYGFSDSGAMVYVINTTTGVASRISSPYNRLIVPDFTGRSSTRGPNGVFGAAMLPV